MPTLVNLKVTNKVPRRKKHGYLQSLFFIVILTIAVFFLLQSSFFNINKISVIGNQQLESGDIVKVSGLALGQNIFKANLSKAEKNITLNPLIKNVHLKRKLPNEIELEVNERQAVALIADKNQFLELDKDGIYLSSTKNITKVNYPIITGDKVLSGKPGDKIASEKITTAIKYINALPEDVRSTILEINVQDKNRIIMYNLDKYQVRLGGSDKIEEKARLYRDLIKNQDKNEKLQYIDLADVDHPAIKPVTPAVDNTTGNSSGNSSANIDERTNGVGQIPD